MKNISRQQVSQVQRKDGHEVIIPSNPLKTRALVRSDVKMPMDDTAIQRAERALEALSTQFEGWMGGELDRLAETRTALLTLGPDSARLEALFRVAHDLRGQASTLGFPLVGVVADGLCRLIERSTPATINMDIVTSCVDAARAIVRENAKGKDNPVAVAIADNLKVTIDLLLRARVNQANAVRRGH